jgi:GGDEF domain-containing protein
VVRTSIQDPRDVVWRLYDDETIVILSHCDIHKVASLKDQMAASIKEMRSQVLSEPPEVIFTSLTYPDEALSANELIDHLETQLKSVKR